MKCVESEIHLSWLEDILQKFTFKFACIENAQHCLLLSFDSELFTLCLRARAARKMNFLIYILVLWSIRFPHVLLPSPSSTSHTHKVAIQFSIKVETPIPKNNEHSLATFPLNVVVPFFKLDKLRANHITVKITKPRKRSIKKASKLPQRGRKR